MCVVRELVGFSHRQNSEEVEVKGSGALAGWSGFVGTDCGEGPD